MNGNPNDHVETIKTGVRGILGIAGPAGGVGMSIVSVKEWLQLLSLAGGLLVAIGTIISLILQLVQKSRQSKAELRLKAMHMERTAHLLCEACRTLHQPPPHCPIPPSERPARCPLRILESAKKEIDSLGQS